MLVPMHTTCINRPAPAALVREILPTRTVTARTNGQDGPTNVVHVGDPAGLFRCPRKHEFIIELRLARTTEH